jgi:hypothetical protein
LEIIGLKNSHIDVCPDTVSPSTADITDRREISSRPRYGIVRGKSQILKLALDRLGKI